MICSKDNHSIVILNFGREEEVCYSTVVLEGKVEKDPNCQAEKQVIVEQIDAPMCFPPFTSHKMSANMTFKCILKLDHGLNKFLIKYCSAQHEIIFHFKPRPTSFCVVPIYLVCRGHDGRFQAPEQEDNSIDSACDRISVGVHLLQSLLAEKLHQGGYGRCTFQLQSDLDPTAPECHVFYSDVPVEEAHSVSSSILWSCIGRELMTSHLGSKKHKYVAFLSSTYYKRGSPKEDQICEDIVGCTSGHVFLGGGGLALVSTGCLHTWATSIEEVVPRLLNSDKVDTTLFMDDSNQRGTYGTCYITTLGAVAHEIGHTFDLGHTTHGIMGPQYHNIHYAFLPDEEERAERQGLTTNCVRQKKKLSACTDRFMHLRLEHGETRLRGSQTSLPSPPGNKMQKSISFVQELKPSWIVPEFRASAEKLPHKDKAFLQSPTAMDSKTPNAFSSKCRGVTNLNRGATQSTHKTQNTSYFEPTYDKNDESTFWAQSCLAILALSKWINPDATEEKPGCINYDKVQRCITSEYGLGVVDIRDDEPKSKLHWIFLKKSGPKIFTIPEHHLLPPAHSLCIIDSVGNVMKTFLDEVDPESTTEILSES